MGILLALMKFYFGLFRVISAQVYHGLLQDSKKEFVEVFMRWLLDFYYSIVALVS